jgi:hypothetical protein
MGIIKKENKKTRQKESEEFKDIGGQVNEMRKVTKKGNEDGRNRKEHLEIKLEE